MRTELIETCSSYRAEQRDDNGNTAYLISDIIAMNCFPYDDRDDELDMAQMRFNLAQWEIQYWETLSEDEVPKIAYFNDYEEAMEFMTVQQVLARML